MLLLCLRLCIPCILQVDAECLVHFLQGVLDLERACLVGHLEGGLTIELLPVHLWYISQKNALQEGSIGLCQEALTKFHSFLQGFLMLGKLRHASVGCCTLETSAHSQK